MTIPSLINKHKENVTVNRVKKIYSTMSQALLLAISSNGTVDEWNFKGDDNETCGEEFVNYIKPGLKILKDCKCKSGCIESSYRYLNGTSAKNNYNISTRHYKMVLSDGSYMWIRENGTGCTQPDSNTNNVCGLIWTDINGAHPPNQYGVDVFIFYIMKDRIISHANDDCEISKDGWGCAQYILTYGNMKYLKRN